MNKVRGIQLYQAFSSFLIPRVNKHFPSWQISDAFTLEHTTLKIHQADEFELLEAPEILNLSNKTQTGESRVQDSM